MKSREETVSQDAELEDGNTDESYSALAKREMDAHEKAIKNKVGAMGVNCDGIGK